MTDAQIAHAIRSAIARHRPRVSVAEVARAMNLSYMRLYNVCAGRTSPSRELIDQLREHLGLPDDWPAREASSRLDSGGTMTRVSLAGTPMVTVPVVGHASAGMGVTNVDVEEDEVLVPERMAQLGGIGFIIDGDSMMPALMPGDVAVFREARVPRPGYPFLIRSNQNEYRVKILAYQSGGWHLVSINENYPPVPLSEGDELIGMLVGWYRSRGSRETMDSDPGGLKLDPADYRF